MPNKRKSKEAGRRESKILLSARARTSKDQLRNESWSSARLVNNVLDSFDSFWLDSDLKTA